MKKNLTVTGLILFASIGTFIIDSPPLAFAGHHSTVKTVKSTLETIRTAASEAEEAKKLIKLVRFIEEQIPDLSPENKDIIQELKDTQKIGINRLSLLLKYLNPSSSEYERAIKILCSHVEDKASLELLYLAINKISSDLTKKLVFKDFAANPNSLKVLPLLLSHLKMTGNHSSYDFDDLAQDTLNSSILEGLVQHPNILEIFPNFRNYLTNARVPSLRESILRGVLKNPNAAKILPEFRSEFKKFNPEKDSMFMADVLQDSADHLNNGIITADWIIEQTEKIDHDYRGRVLGYLIYRSKDPSLHKRIFDSLDSLLHGKGKLTVMENLAIATKDLSLLKHLYEKCKNDPGANEVVAAIASNELSLSFHPSHSESFDKNNMDENKLFMFLGKASNPNSKLSVQEIKNVLHSLEDLNQKAAVYMALANHSRASEFFESEEYFLGLMSLPKITNIMATYGQSSDSRVEVLTALAKTLKNRGLENSSLAKKVRKSASGLPKPLDQIRVLLYFT